MSAQDTLSKIAELFGQLGTGVADPQLERVIYQQLAEDFAQLALDLGSDTGWVAMLGTATKGGINTATATTKDVAEVVKALVDKGISTGSLLP